MATLISTALRHANTISPREAPEYGCPRGIVALADPCERRTTTSSCLVRGLIHVRLCTRFQSRPEYLVAWMRVEGRARTCGRVVLGALVHHLYQV